MNQIPLVTREKEDQLPAVAIEIVGNGMRLMLGDMVEGRIQGKRLSSTCMARQFTLDLSGSPFGTAQLLNIASFSSLKSKWCVRAWCSWITKRGIV